MNAGIVSGRYARALLMYADECGVAEEVYRGTQQLFRCLQRVPKLVEALSNPLLTQEKKTTLLCRAAGLAADGPFRHFAEVVLARRREDHLLLICRVYALFYEESRRLLTVRLTLAHPPEEEEPARQITARLETVTGKQVEMYTAVDAALEAGFTLEADNCFLDASLRGRMDRIRKQLAGRY